MKTSHHTINEYIFNPFELKILIEKEEEYRDLYYFFSFYQTLPPQTFPDKERSNRLVKALAEIHDELHVAGL